jgi:hypothetical protein
MYLPSKLRFVRIKYFIPEREAEEACLCQEDRYQKFLGATKPRFLVVGADDDAGSDLPVKAGFIDAGYCLATFCKVLGRKFTSVANDVHRIEIRACEDKRCYCRGVDTNTPASCMFPAMASATVADLMNPRISILLTEFSLLGSIDITKVRKSVSVITGLP